MMNLLNKLGTKKAEIILIAIVLFAIVMPLVKETMMDFLKDILLSELNGSIFEILN